MNLLVCISKTPDTTAKISFKSDDKEYNSDGVNFIMNPYDEWYALVRAIEIVESNGGNVTAINVGPASNDIIIRKALAIGANDAIRVNLENPDAFTTASNIAEVAKTKNFDIIFPDGFTKLKIHKFVVHRNRYPHCGNNTCYFFIQNFFSYSFFKHPKWV